MAVAWRVETAHPGNDAPVCSAARSDAARPDPPSRSRTAPSDRLVSCTRRVTYYLDPDRKVITLTTSQKQRDSERRARSSGHAQVVVEKPPRSAYPQPAQAARPWSREGTLELREANLLLLGDATVFSIMLVDWPVLAEEPPGRRERPRAGSR